MLLRRITKHVSDQNWFAVFIDFLIVVVGVFIGIQVTNWNAQRVEQSLEIGYIERLKNDIEESRVNTKRTNKRWIARVDLLNLVIDSLDKCELVEDDKDNFAEGLSHLGKFEMAFFNDSTLEEMRSTGRLGVISNTKINSALAAIERGIRYQERVEPQLIAHLSPHIAYAKQRVRFEVRSTEDGILTGDENFSHSSIATYDLEALCGDSKFIASVSSVRATLHELLEWNNRIAVLMDEALVLITKELENQ